MCNEKIEEFVFPGNIPGKCGEHQVNKSLFCLNCPSNQTIETVLDDVHEAICSLQKEMDNVIMTGNLITKKKFEILSKKSPLVFSTMASFFETVMITASCVAEQFDYLKKCLDDQIYVHKTNTNSQEKC